MPVNADWQSRRVVHSYYCALSPWWPPVHGRSAQDRVRAVVVLPPVLWKPMPANDRVYRASRVPAVYVRVKLPAPAPGPRTRPVVDELLPTPYLSQRFLPANYFAHATRQSDAA